MLKPPYIVFIFVILLICNHSFAAPKALKVAIVDAFFCRHLKTKNIIPKDMTGENDLYGKKCDESRKYHGNKVAREFLKSFKASHPLELYLYKVFTKEGNQDTKALKLALLDIKKNEIDATIMAIGFFNYKDLPQDLPTLTLVAAGASGNGVNGDEMLWPQMLENPNLVLFAHYFPSQASIKTNPKSSKNIFEGHIDPSLMNLNKVNFFIPSPPNPTDLSGSSLATAVGSGMLLRACFPLKNLSDCLKNHTHSLTILNSKLSKNFSTFN
ncbi:MAG: hypothetical protein ACOYL6_01380 [Bacteriovoracaceae bacterium]